MRNSKINDRLQKLELLLAERGVLHLKDAADMLGVSQMTVRRDIAGVPERLAYLGGHIVLASGIEGDQPYDLIREADSHSNAKRAACSHAVSLIRDDDTIFIDCGTTMTHLVDLLPRDLRITTVCYALNIAERLARNPNIRIIMLGGLYHASSASFSGSPGFETLKQLGINRAFISAAGLDLRRGATCAHFHEAPIKRQAISLAQSSYLILDSSKIGRVKASFFADLSDFRAVITENGNLDMANIELDEGKP